MILSNCLKYGVAGSCKIVEYSCTSESTNQQKEQKITTRAVKALTSSNCWLWGSNPCALMCRRS